MYSGKDLRLFIVWVSPFGYPRVNAYFQLAAAFRRLSRPSSAFSAKAFSLRSFSLEQPSCFSFFPKNILRFFCLSFANNCFWVVIEKTILVFFHVFVRLEDEPSSKLTKLFFYPLIHTEKPFIIFCFIITSFSHNYLFRFFSLFGFQWTPSFFEKKEGKETFIMGFSHMTRFSLLPPEGKKAKKLSSSVCSHDFRFW